MPDDDTRLHEAEDESRQRRQQALRSLAQESAGIEVSKNPTYSAPNAGQAPSSPHKLTAALTPPSRRRWWIASLVLALGMVALASLSYFTVFRPGLTAQPVATATPLPVIASITQDSLTCMKDMAISPDGASLAILGYHLLCPSDNSHLYAYRAGQINLYATTSGQFITSIHPDDSITNILHLRVPSDVRPASRASDTSHANIQYHQIFWSPGGTQLAIAFSIPMATSSTVATSDRTPSAYIDGLLLTDPHGTHTRVLAHTLGGSTRYTGAWNPMAGSYISIPASADRSRGMPAPAALSFIWMATHTLAPQGPVLSLNSVPPTPAIGPIGNPLGSHSFTIWQPATIRALTTAHGEPIAGLFRYTTDFPIWSPDGSRLVTEMRLDGILALAGHVSFSSVTPPLDLSTPLVPARDPGLAAALAGQKRFTYVDGGAIELSVAWRPDGRVVAIRTPSAASPGTPGWGPGAIHLYDCASGKLLAAMHERTITINPDTTIFLRWTPDGSHLLLLNAETTQLAIWGPDQLPKG